MVSSAWSSLLIQLRSATACRKSSSAIDREMVTDFAEGQAPGRRPDRGPAAPLREAGMMQLTLDEVLEADNLELGTSSWIEIDQGKIDRFADATDDRQWIHVDVERARASEAGGTIAHGFLMLSLLPKLFFEIVEFPDLGRMINFGVDKVRFLRTGPVRLGDLPQGAADLGPQARRRLPDADLRRDAAARQRPPGGGDGSAFPGVSGGLTVTPVVRSVFEESRNPIRRPGGGRSTNRCRSCDRGRPRTHDGTERSWPRVPTWGFGWVRAPACYLFFGFIARIVALT